MSKKMITEADILRDRQTVLRREIEDDARQLANFEATSQTSDSMPNFIAAKVSRLVFPFYFGGRRFDVVNPKFAGEYS